MRDTDGFFKHFEWADGDSSPGFSGAISVQYVKAESKEVLEADYINAVPAPTINALGDHS